MSRTLVLGTAGHIDHGKSALVTALTGTNPDRLKEEQARGITIDLGFAHAEIGGVTVAFVDVPGHERFVRNMLAGAGGIDAVLLVVAADESVMPQTREHFHICRLLGIDRGVVALTKSDLADADMRAVAAEDVRDLVAGSFLDGARIVPVSVRSGEGLDELRDAIAALSAPKRSRGARNGLVRLPIDRAFTMKGFGVVVTGTLVSGSVSAGDELAVLPADRRVRMRGLQVHGRSADRVEAPSRLAVNLGGVEMADVARGMTLATTGSLSLTTRVDARLELLPGAPPLRHGARVRVHHGTSECAGRVTIAAIRAGRDREWTGALPGAAAVAVPSGGEAFVRLRLEQPAAITRGDRLVLRAYSPPTTIAGAIVIDPVPPAGRLRRAAALDRFQRLDGAGPAAALALVVQEAGARGVERSALVPRLGFGAAEAASAAERSDVIVAGARLFDPAAAAQLGDEVERTLADFHQRHPHDAGLPRETLRAALASKAAIDLIDDVLQRLAGARRIAGTDRLALARHAPAVSDEDRRARDAIAARLRAAGLTPPELTQLREDAGVSPAVFERLLSAMIREKVLTRLGTLVFHTDALAALRSEIRAARDTPGGATVDVAIFKQKYGLTRKFAIPLLEWLDRERVTRRSGETRVVL